MKREERLVKESALLALCLNLLALEAVLSGEPAHYRRVMRLAAQAQRRSVRRMRAWMATGRLDEEKARKAHRLVRKMEAAT